jgi:hypothetical protein
MTIVYAAARMLPELHTMRSMTVHVLGANSSKELKTPIEWNEVLYHLPLVEHLEVVLFGRTALAPADARGTSLASLVAWSHSEREVCLSRERRSRERTWRELQVEKMHCAILQ